MVTHKFHPSFRYLFSRLRLYNILLSFQNTKKSHHHCLRLLLHRTELIGLFLSHHDKLCYLVFRYLHSDSLPGCRHHGYSPLERLFSQRSDITFYYKYSQYIYLFLGVFSTILRCLAAFRTQDCLSIPKQSLAISVYSQQVD